jgi:hypothetical protein
MNTPEWTTKYGVTSCSFGWIKIAIEWKDGQYHATIHSFSRTIIRPQPTLTEAKQAALKVAIGKLKQLIPVLEADLEAERNEE